MTLRMRMTLAIVAILAITTAVLGATVVIATRASMLRQIDRRLEQISNRPSAPPRGPFFPGRPPGEEVGGGGPPVEVTPPSDESNFEDGSGFRPEAVILLNTDGEVQATQPAGFPEDPLALPELPSDPVAALEVPTTIAGDGVRYRAIATDVPFGAIVFAIPLIDVEATSARSLFVVLAMGTLVVVAGGLVAWAAIGRQLRPINTMIDTAAEIAAGDLSRRVDTPKDGSELARLASALNAMLTQLQASFAEREASQDRLKRFVGDAAHELRTPLTSIRGYAELYRTGALEPGEEMGRAMDRVERESTRMQVIIDDMVLLARLDQSQPMNRVAVDLSELAVDGVNDLLAAEPDRPATVDAPAPVMVVGDEDRLRQVIGNLLSNASSHTPPSTPVSVSVRAEDGVAILRVTDDGPGMDPDVRAKVFDRFFRGDPSRSRDTGGAGLGLSIVSAIVSAHGGTVDLESAPGKGTTFSVTLPLEAAERE